MPLGKKLKKHISGSFSKLKSPVEVLLFTSGKYPKVEAQTEDALKDIVSLSPKLSLKKYRADSTQARKEGVGKGPAIVLHGREKGKVRYFGFPSGYQFPVFILDVHDVSGVVQRVSRKDADRAGKIPRGKTHLEVFQMPPCRFCPVAVKTAHDLAILNGNVTADMVDALLFPELVKKYGIREVPTTVINGKQKIAGVKTLPELLEILGKGK